MKIDPASSDLIGEDDSSTSAFWSVMIPAYNPEHYLKQTIESVLAHNIDDDEMQIEVVDDCSPEVDVQPLVRQIAGDRVGYFRRPERGGLATCWNSCIERAKGKWVHILHQDDVVLPGFYQKLREGIEREPAVGAAFCRHVNINENGHWVDFAPIQANQAGIIPDWLNRIAARQLVTPPAIVVSSEAYRKVGMYSVDLVYVIDWDMWKRIAVEYPVWYEPQPLAGYRVHSASETGRLVRTGADINDVRTGLEKSRSYLPKDVYEWSRPIAADLFARMALKTARAKIVSGEYSVAYKQINGAVRLSHSIDFLSELTALAVWSGLNFLKYAPRKLFRSSGMSPENGEKAVPKAIEHE